VDQVLPGTPSSLRWSVENDSEKGFLDLCLNQRNHNEFFLEHARVLMSLELIPKNRTHSQKLGVQEVVG